MRILLVHNRYQEPGGEDAVFKAERLLLQQEHEVSSLLFDNDEIPHHRTMLDVTRLATSTIWSRRATTRLADALMHFRPDLVHFHNTFPLVSPAAYSVCRRARVAVVQTLHNYRLLCPNALFFRDGHACEDCLGRTPPWPGVLHACYRDSRSQTAVVATMLTAHRILGTWRRDVDVYIALSEFSRQKFLQGGLPPQRVVVKPNFLDPDPGPRTDPGSSFLFVGRLVDYKGIRTLLQSWQQSNLAMGLCIAGDGPLADEVTRAAGSTSGIEYLGPLPRPSILKHMHRSRALIFPSVLYENFPVTIVEAFACGVPVIASRIGAMAEIVDDGRTGLLFEAEDWEDLLNKVKWAWRHPEELSRMGIEARREFETKYTAEANSKELAKIYALAIAHAQARL